MGFVNTHRMIELQQAGSDEAALIAEFTRTASPLDVLSARTVRRTFFGDPDPSITLRLGHAALGAAVVRGNRGYIKFLAVQPESRRDGLGSALLAALEQFCREHGAITVEAGGSAP